MFKKISLFAAVMLFVVTSITAQQQYKMGLVGFYNLENLYGVRHLHDRHRQKRQILFP